MATQRYWAYSIMPDVSAGQGRMMAAPIPAEPHLETGTVDTGSGAAATAAMPATAGVVVIRPAAAVYYLVRRSGDSTAADNTCRQLVADTDSDPIHVLPGDTVSMLEV